MDEVLAEANMANMEDTERVRVWVESWMKSRGYSDLRISSDAGMVARAIVEFALEADSRTDREGS